MYTLYNLSHGTHDISNLDRKNYTMSSVDLCIDCLLLSRMFCSVEGCWSVQEAAGVWVTMLQIAVLQPGQ